MELLINDLTKQYADKTAIDHVSCRLTPGITGLLGANGAGKSTLMRMVCGVMRPTCGSVELDGYDVTEKEYRNLIGYLPQDFGYYPEFTGMEFLLYVAALKGLDRQSARERSRELLAQVNLEKDADKKIRAYSGGMKQRLGRGVVSVPLPAAYDRGRRLCGACHVPFAGAGQPLRRNGDHGDRTVPLHAERPGEFGLHLEAMELSPRRVHRLADVYGAPADLTVRTLFQ